MGLQLIDNTGISVHRILCTDSQEVTDTAIVSESRIFIGSQKLFCKAAMGTGFVLAARFQGNHAGESRVLSSAVNSRRIQNGVHNSGDKCLYEHLGSFPCCDLCRNNHERILDSRCPYFLPLFNSLIQKPSTPITLSG